MGRSHVKFRGNAFEAHDLDQLVWSDYAKRRITSLKEPQPWLAEMRERLGVPYSFCSILDQHLIDDDRIGAFLHLNQAVIQDVAREGETIQVSRLKEIDTGNAVGWITPYETRFILEFASKLELLITGHGTITAVGLQP